MGNSIVSKDYLQKYFATYILTSQLCVYFLLYHKLSHIHNMETMSNQTTSSSMEMIILDSSFIKTCTSTTMTDNFEPHPDTSFLMVPLFGILWLELLRFLTAVVLVNILYFNICIYVNSNIWIEIQTKIKQKKTILYIYLFVFLHFLKLSIIVLWLSFLLVNNNSLLLFSYYV